MTRWPRFVEHESMIFVLDSTVPGILSMPHLDLAAFSFMAIQPFASFVAEHRVAAFQQFAKAAKETERPNPLGLDLTGSSTDMDYFGFRLFINAFTNYSRHATYLPNYTIDIGLTRLSERARQLLFLEFVEESSLGARDTLLEDAVRAVLEDDHESLGSHSEIVEISYADWSTELPLKQKRAFLDVVRRMLIDASEFATEGLSPGLVVERELA